MYWVQCGKYEYLSSRKPCLTLRILITLDRNQIETEIELTIMITLSFIIDLFFYRIVTVTVVVNIL